MDAFGSSCSLQCKFFQLKSALLIELIRRICALSESVCKASRRWLPKFADADVMRIEPAGRVGFRQYIVMDLPRRISTELIRRSMDFSLFVVSFEAKVSIRNWQFRGALGWARFRRASSPNSWTLLMRIFHGGERECQS